MLHKTSSSIIFIVSMINIIENHIIALHCSEFDFQNRDPGSVVLPQQLIIYSPPNGTFITKVFRQTGNKWHVIHLYYG